MATREEKYKAFRALHERPGIFLIPNPWNAGSAKILTALGFEALATTSAGYAFNAGRMDTNTSIDSRGSACQRQGDRGSDALAGFR